MHYNIFTVLCPKCGKDNRTKAQTWFSCSYCHTSLTLDDITIVKMEKYEFFEEAMLLSSDIKPPKQMSAGAR